MPTLTIAINGRDYQIACDDGQEEHLRRLADEVDERVRQLSYRMGNGAENLLLLLTSLMMADEMHDVRRDLEHVKAELRRVNSDIGHQKQSIDQDKLLEMEAAMASTLDEIAQRIEKIAEQLELH